MEQNESSMKKMHPFTQLHFTPTQLKITSPQQLPEKTDVNDRQTIRTAFQLSTKNTKMDNLVKFLTFMVMIANRNRALNAAVPLDDRSSGTFCTLNIAQGLQKPLTLNQRLWFSHVWFSKSKPTDVTTLDSSR